MIQINCLNTIYPKRQKLIYIISWFIFTLNVKTQKSKSKPDISRYIEKVKLGSRKVA